MAWARYGMGAEFVLYLYSFGISIGMALTAMLWCKYGICIEIATLMNSWYGIGMVLVCYWYGIGMVLVWYWRGIGIVLVWYCYGIGMVSASVFVWCWYGICMVVVWGR